MANISISELKDILKELINESIYDVPDQEDTDAIKPYGGWLDPDCKFHPVAYQEHGCYAAHVLRQMGVTRDLYHTSYEELYKRKFIRIQFGNKTLYFQYSPTDQQLPAPTPKQMKALRDTAIEYQCDSLWDENANKQVWDDLLQESTELVGLKYWWMDSHYKLHPVSFEQHRQWAEEYLKRVGYGYTRDVYKAMFKLGFVRLVKQNYNGEKLLSYQYTKERPLNSKQLKHIKDLAIEERCDYMIDDVTSREISLKESLNEVSKKLFTPDGNLRWWLDVRGDLHDVSKEGHHAHALKAMTKKFGSNHHIVSAANADFEVPYDVFFHEGWVRLVYVTHDRLLCYEYHHKKPTSSQMDTITELGEKLHALAMFDEHTGKVRPLYESVNEDMSYEELLKMTTPERKERSANVNVRSLPVTVENNNEQWNFRYKSSPQTTVTDKPFKGSISFLKGKVGQNNNAMKMKCKVDCECPDFMYRFAYNDAAKGASQIGSDSLNKAINRKPKPAYDEGVGLCKHLVALGKFLKTKIQATKKSNLFEAIDDVAKQGPFNVEYYD